MDFIINFTENSPGMAIPNNIFAWLLWVALLIGLSIFVVRSGKSHALSSGQWILFLVLGILVPLSILLIGNRIPLFKISSFAPGFTQENTTTVVLFLASIPYILAAGFLGMVPAVILGFFSGIFSSLWITHSIFTPLEIAGLAAFFSFFIRQNYPTKFFQICRHPIIAGLFSIIIISPLFAVVTNLNLAEPIQLNGTNLFNYIFLHSAIRLMEFMIAGLLAEGIYISQNKNWIKERILNPPRMESLQEQIYTGMGLIQAGLVFFLFLIGWLVAVKAARSMIVDRLDSSARVIGESLPYFLETGQNLLSGIAEEVIWIESPEDKTIFLEKKLSEVPYFQQLVFVDEEGNYVAGHPENANRVLKTLQKDTQAFELASKGAPIQVITIPPAQEGEVAGILLVAALSNENGDFSGVIAGRTDLVSNPFSQPATQVLNSIREGGGMGIILDDDKRIIYHSNPSMLVKEFPDILPEGKRFFDGYSPDGIRNMYYFYPTIGKSWSVLLSMPFSRAAELALSISLPLIGLSIFISILTFIIFRVSLKNINGSVKRTFQETAMTPLETINYSKDYNRNEDFGPLAQAFELMRLDLKARVEELSSLFMVSQVIAAKLDTEFAISQILEVSLERKSASARIVIANEKVSISPEEKFSAFFLGNQANIYDYLDDQLFSLMKGKDHLVIEDFARNRIIKILEGQKTPGAIIAFSIHQGKQYFGVFYLIYENPTSFSGEETNYLQTLANQAAIAVSRGKLFELTEQAGQKLKAILDSVPAPILYVDEQLRLVLINSAASQLSFISKEPNSGKFIHEVIQNQKLLDLFGRPIEDKDIFEEIILKEGKSYRVSISPVSIKNTPAGKIGILRDITPDKEGDQLKTEFVSTVSHDLRSPLSLVRGYASMLQMVGDLNEQQKGYANKIVVITDSMTKLVGNLLDINRIEDGIGLKLEQVQADEIVKTVVNILQPQINQKKINFTLDIPETQPLILEVDTTLIQQALFNLLENAIKFTQVNGKILMRFRKNESNILFEIVDTGIGIAPLDISHIFEKFYEVGMKDNQEYRGTGLGLAIVKSIAQRHNGRVWAVSQLGKGSVFYFEIPTQQHTQKTRKVN